VRSFVVQGEIYKFLNPQRAPSCRWLRHECELHDHANVS